MVGFRAGQDIASSAKRLVWAAIRGTRGFSAVRDVTTHLHVVPRLVSGAAPPLSHVFTACTETALR
jgi:hypothetical protein